MLITSTPSLLASNNTWTGKNLFQDAVDALDAFQVRNAAGDIGLSYDTVNMRFGIGTASPGDEVSVYKSSNAKVIVGNDVAHTSHYTAFNSQDWTIFELLRNETASASGATAFVFTTNIATPSVVNDAIGQLIFLNRQLPALERRMAIFGTGYDASNSGRFFWYTLNAGSLAQRMVLKSDGRLGINVDAPAGMLHAKPNSTTLPGIIIEGISSYTGKYIIIKSSAGTEFVTVSSNMTVNLPFKLTNIKSGATQVAAGAAASEVWKTAGHASLPDNTLMIGV